MFLGAFRDRHLRLRSVFKLAALSLLVVGSVWLVLGRLLPEKGLLTSIASALSALDATAVCFFLLLWGISILLRASRYPLVARAWRSSLALGVSLRATLIGRSFTLLTPTCLFGGQPVSYYLLVVHGTPRRIAGAVVFVATLLDLGFFVVFFPVFLLIGTRTPFAGPRLRWTFVGSLIAFLLVIAMGGILRTRFAERVATVFARIGSVFPFWRRDDLDRTFRSWRELLVEYLSLSKLLSSNGIIILGCSALIHFSHYVGMWFLLRRIGSSQSLVQSVGAQVLVNFGTLLLSPGAGSVTGEVGFYHLIGPTLPTSLLLGGMFLFMAGSYWLPAVAGPLVLGLERTHRCVLNVHLMPVLLREVPTQASVCFQLDNGRLFERRVNGCAEHTFILPSDERGSLEIRMQGEILHRWPMRLDRDVTDIELGP